MVNVQTKPEKVPSIQADDGTLIPVQCKFTRLVSLGELRPHPRNPNTHTPAQIEAYVKIIRHQGWRRPIVVSLQSGYITRGHGALLAATELGHSVVPVDFQAYGNEADELADMVADNQLARWAEMDYEAAAEILKLLPEGFDKALTGFSAGDIENLTAGIFNPEAPEGAAGETISKSVTFTMEQIPILNSAIAQMRKNGSTLTEAEAVTLICQKFIAE